MPYKFAYETDAEFVLRRMLALRHIDENGCWLWQGELTPGGYGRIVINYERKMVHRVSFELYKEPIPNGLDVDHLCFVRRCFNPKHLEAVTRSVNVQRAADRVRIGGE